MDLRIVAGPFRQMRYLRTAFASAHSAKLLGTYEKELHDVIANISHGDFQTVIDIGAAEGYYAVGLARKLSSSNVRVIAFEQQQEGRDLLKKLAAYNSVDNLDIHGECGTHDLETVLGQPGRTLIVCDVEGYEIHLLDPQLIRGLLDCWILVELHDTPGVPVSEVIRKRFDQTHSISKMTLAPRSWDDFPVKNIFSRILPRGLALRAMNECRSSQDWFWMRPLKTDGEGSASVHVHS